MSVDHLLDWKAERIFFKAKEERKKARKKQVSLIEFYFVMFARYRLIIGTGGITLTELDGKKRNQKKRNEEKKKKQRTITLSG